MSASWQALYCQSFFIVKIQSQINDQQHLKHRSGLSYLWLKPKYHLELLILHTI